MSKKSHLKKTSFFLSLFTIFLFFISPQISAQNNSDQLIVGTKIAPPFSMKDTNGEWEGISIELWKRIAEELNLKYRDQFIKKLMFERIKSRRNKSLEDTRRDIIIRSKG